MAQEYNVIATQPWTYLDKTGRVVNGYRVFVAFPKFDETHQVEVPTLAPEVVKRAIEEVLSQRKNIAAL
jgi:hypothetical protein